MALNTKDFATLVSDQVTAVQASASRLIDTTVGSIIRAIVESNAAVALWMQGLVLRLLAATRASTSTDDDLDTWMADYGLFRLPAVAATGNATFSRFTATIPGRVPVGSRVQTGDGTQIFEVVADTSNPAYSDGAYVLAAGVQTIIVKVQAVAAGAGNNVVAGAINTLATAISGVDTVTNAAAFTNGSDAESDTAFRARFVAYVASLSKGTVAAVDYALASLQIGLTRTIIENQTYGGATDYGYFYVVVDDGTGFPGSTLLANVSNAIERVRPVSSRFGVFAPVVVTASVTMAISVSPGYDPITTKLAVKTALTDFINGLGLGQSLIYNRLFQLTYNVPGVASVNSLLVNGLTADIATTPRQAIKAATVVVS